ncbi:hypothetical protein AMS59_13920 [Lysinibacillus sp. FJAT-14745]|uniref:hypothetical protein n=1 Tax=Lysinibacillus sp. FJAT-14745 TaxID=1704289 RepID=UPI0006AB8654|nr:hypothetical protein [Lysinibacillus sp. FJAT-14745]KOP77742.1 hypothetical protein AMS59_13920 [Lysinibacillus sp. FJAT-14745]
MNELIIDVMNSFNDYISKIPAGCDSIAMNLQQEDYEVALNLIVDFSEGFEWLKEVQLLLIKNEYNSNIDFDLIQGFLEEINTGLEKRDFIVVSDIFEYEIKPFFENCTPYEILEDN